MIETTIGKHVIVFKWQDEFPCLWGDELRIEYDVDVSETPRHLANFMLGMVLLDAFLWCKKPVTFNELTLNEKTGLEENILMSHRSRGCCGYIYEINDSNINNEPPKIQALKIVEEEPLGEGPILVSNGMGKDALNATLLTKEMGFEPRCFIVGHHIPRKDVWAERVRTTHEFYTTRKIKSNIIITNFFQLRHSHTNIGFYPYFFGYPLAVAYDSDTILGATEIHNSKVHTENFSVQCGPESIFTANYVSKASGIRFSSPTRAVTEYGSQKVFSERYPEAARFQRSCDKGLPYCDNCSKCRRTALNLSTAGFDPIELCLSPFQDGDLDFSHYHRHHRSDQNVINKLFGKPYEDWVEKANIHALDLIWQGNEIKKIFSEHLDLYDYDPGIDEWRYTLAPSKWRNWLEKGITSFMK